MIKAKQNKTKLHFTMLSWMEKKKVPRIEREYHTEGEDWKMSFWITYYYHIE